MRSFFLILVVCSTVVGCGSRSRPTNRTPRDASYVPPAGIAVSLFVFKRESNRWPKDFEELLQFCRSHYDQWEIGHYDQVVFTPLTDGSLDVFAVAGSWTNRMTIKQ